MGEAGAHPQQSKVSRQQHEQEVEQDERGKDNNLNREAVWLSKQRNRPANC